MIGRLVRVGLAIEEDEGPAGQLAQVGVLLGDRFEDLPIRALEALANVFVLFLTGAH